MMKINRTGTAVTDGTLPTDAGNKRARSPMNLGAGAAIPAGSGVAPLWVLIAASLVSGVLWAFYGKRKFRMAALVSGVLSGLVIGAAAGRLGELLADGAAFEGALVLEACTSISFSLPVLAGALAGAALVGLLCIPYFYMTVFLSGFGTGFGLFWGLLLLTHLNGVLADPLMIILLGAVACGFLVAWLARRYRIFFTSMTGAFHLAAAMTAILAVIVGAFSTSGLLPFAKLLSAAGVLTLLSFWVAGFIVQKRGQRHDASVSR